jgi:hypothetical protein
MRPFRHVAGDSLAASAAHFRRPPCPAGAHRHLQPPSHGRTTVRCTSQHTASHSPPGQRPPLSPVGLRTHGAGGSGQPPRRGAHGGAHGGDDDAGWPGPRTAPALAAWLVGVALGGAVWCAPAAAAGSVTPSNGTSVEPGAAPASSHLQDLTSKCEPGAAHAAAREEPRSDSDATPRLKRLLREVFAELQELRSRLEVRAAAHARPAGQPDGGVHRSSSRGMRRARLHAQLAWRASSPGAADFALACRQEAEAAQAARARAGEDAVVPLEGFSVRPYVSALCEGAPLKAPAQVRPPPSAPAAWRLTRAWWLRPAHKELWAATAAMAAIAAIAAAACRSAGQRLRGHARELRGGPGAGGGAGRRRGGARGRAAVAAGGGSSGGSGGAAPAASRAAVRLARRGCCAGLCGGRRGGWPQPRAALGRGSRRGADARAAGRARRGAGRARPARRGRRGRPGSGPRRHGAPAVQLRGGRRCRGRRAAAGGRPREAAAKGPPARCWRGSRAPASAPETRCPFVPSLASPGAPREGTQRPPLPLPPAPPAACQGGAGRGRAAAGSGARAAGVRGAAGQPVCGWAAGRGLRGLPAWAPRLARPLHDDLRLSARLCPPGAVSRPQA